MLHYVWWLCDVDCPVRPPKLAAKHGANGADVCAFHPEVEDFKDLGWWFQGSFTINS